MNNKKIKEISSIKLLLIEDGSVDLDELKGLPENIKVIVYRQGSQKPVLMELKDKCIIETE